METKKSSEALSRSCALLQTSHWALARNDLDRAKADALSACNNINNLLRSPDAASKKLISQLALFALDLYERITKKGVGALSAQERFGWLTSASAATGGMWYPILVFGEFSSTDIAPFEPSDDSIALPDYGAKNPIKFRPIEASLPSIESLSLNGQFSRESESESLQDIYQDVLSDCSFVSSLLSASELNLSPQLKTLVTVFDNQTAKVRLKIDGFWREVGMTTMLPHFDSTNGRNLFVRSNSNRSLLWPALLEKAYVTSFKEHYAFDGSNMSSDTFMMTGWLPEIRSMNKVDQETLINLWRLKTSGDLMIGLGTASMSPELEQSLGFISNHDYVLSGFDENSGVWTLTNPWAFRESHDSKDSKSRRTLKVERTIFRHFKFLYLNWNCQAKQESKSYFIQSPSKWPASFLGDKPQFRVRNKSQETQEIMVLVENFQQREADFCVSVWEDCESIVFTNNQHKCVSGGNYVNSKHQLLRLKLKRDQDYVMSIVSRESKTNKFCLTVYHDMENFSVERAQSSYQFTHPLITGNWNLRNSGGNWSNETFITNPQYDFEAFGLSSRCIFVLACENETLNINVYLIHCSAGEKNKRIRKLDLSTLVFNEKYSSSFFVKEVNDLESGHYKLLVSTYNRGDLGEFRLLVANDGERPFELVPTPHALGTFTQETFFEWKSSNRKKLEVSIQNNQTRVTFHLRSGENDSQQKSNYRPAIRASVFDAFTRQPVVVTTQWNDSVYGSFLDCCLPESDRSYILLVERFETGDGVCRISMGSSHRITIQEMTDE